MVRHHSSFCIVLLFAVSAIAQEAEKPTPGQENLRQFKMWIGEWESKDKDGKTERVSFEWINNKSYILFTAGAFREVIGWDLKKKAITSWGFGTNGGQGKLDWTKDGDVWKASVRWLDRWGKEVPVWRTIKVDGDKMETVWSYGGAESTYHSTRIRN